MLSVEGVSLHYGAAQALRSVSLTVEVGRITCLMGRNGVGKTSLLRAIAGQHPVSAGSIGWEGKSLAGLKPFERARRGIGYVPQGREIFPLLSVRENLETGFAPLPRAKRSIPDTVFELFPVLKDIGRAIRFLRAQGDMAILLVEQYFEFARDLADSFAVMDRGEIVLQGAKADMVESDVRRYLTV